MVEPLDTPYIDRPEEHEAGSANELYCWIPGSSDRECSGACVAYDPRFASDQRLTSCMALNTFRSMGMSLVTLSNVYKQEARKMPQPKPPEVK